MRTSQHSPTANHRRLNTAGDFLYPELNFECYTFSMNILDFFRKKKDEKNAAADASATFIPVTTASGSSAPQSGTAPSGADSGTATSTDAGASSFGGDGGAAGGGDGGGI